MICCSLITVVIILFSTTIVFGVPVKPDDSLNAPDDILFQNFQQNYKINFTNDAEKSQRFNIFKQNLAKIRSLNSAKTGATFGINEFAAITPEEFKATKVLPENFKLPNFTSDDNDDNDWHWHWWHIHNHRNRRQAATPEAFDWRAKNMVTPVQNQGGCGSCWAFATIAGIEAHYAIAHNGTKVGLSEQNIVDCDSKNFGCNGGWMYEALEYARNFGLSTKANYPYTAVTGTCKTNANEQKIKVDGVVQLPARNEGAMKTFLLQKGPIIFAFTCTSSYQYYAGGIFSLNAQQCNDQSIGLHAMVLVGYGIENGKKFWIAKNSWGEYWGEGGYIRFERDINFCDMSSYAVAPVFKQATPTTTTTTTTPKPTTTTTTKLPSTTTTTTTPKPATITTPTRLPTPTTTKSTTKPNPSTTCPICSSLRVTANESDLPSVFKNTRQNVGCGSVKPMDSNCISTISCYSTYKSKNSYINIYAQHPQYWRGYWSYANVGMVYNYTCTSKGWIDQNYPNEPLINDLIVCQADLAPNAKKHSCPA